VLESIRSGAYGQPAIFEPLLQTLDFDHYLLHADFSLYLETMQKVDECYKDKVTQVLVWGNSVVTGLVLLT
jgi:starch phosphorylase